MGRIALSSAIVAFAILGVVASCLPRGVFGCEADDQCDGITAGRCEPDGYCSFEDDDCASGRRYDEYAADTVRGRCVPPDTAETSDGTSSGTLESSTSSDSGESSTGRVPACGDDVIDPGEDCDDGNEIDADGCNRDCRESGAVIWERRHGPPGGMDDKAYDVAVRADGGIVVVGQVGTEDVAADLWAREYGPDGSEGWTFVVDEGTQDAAWAATATDAGTVLVAGYVTLETTGQDIWVGELNSGGMALWDELFDGASAGDDQGRSVAILGDGDIALSGQIGENDAEGGDIFVRRLNPTATDERWSVVVPGTDMGEDRADAVAIAPSGDVLGCGVLRSSGIKWWLARFDAAGEQLFIDPFPGNDDESQCIDIAILPSGGYVAVGRHNADIVIRAYTAADELDWDVSVAGTNDDEDKANAVAVDSVGNIVVAGELGAGAGSTDFWVGKYDAAGNEWWTRPDSGPAGVRDTAWGVAIAPNDEIVAVGYEAVPGEGFDIVVRKYTP